MSDHTTITSQPHAHAHAHCQHAHLAYCPVCSLAYCQDCGAEWRQSVWWTTTSYGYPAGVVLLRGNSGTGTGDYQLGYKAMTNAQAPVSIPPGGHRHGG